MMSENTSRVRHDRPFPWRCIECGAQEVIPQATGYTTTVKHDGCNYTIRLTDLEIPTCRQCGARVFTGTVDDRIVAALRAQVGLLTPEEIQKRRRELKLNQQEIAEQLGITQETISRWETGALIQSRAMDNLLRLYFDSDDVRARLRRRFKQVEPIPGTTVN